LSNSSNDSDTNRANANHDEFFSSMTDSAKGNSKYQGSWGSTDSEGANISGRTTDPEKLEEMRKRREERKLHRQNELETKRTTTRKGPMKLGAKKI